MINKDYTIYDDAVFRLTIFDDKDMNMNLFKIILTDKLLCSCKYISTRMVFFKKSIIFAETTFINNRYEHRKNTQ